MKNPLSHSEYSKRRNPRKSDIRGSYFRDQTAIIHSTPFRRLKSKTQVFYAPENDHICTRIEHVLHVATIARTICKGLNLNGWELNDEMAYAIGLGHDLGHTPFGHVGEKALNNKLGGGSAFVHEINSYRQVEYLANSGKGLNLTYGVKDGIINHNGEKDEQRAKPVPKVNDLDNITKRNTLPSSYEGCIMRFSDKIAYLGRDIEDAFVAGFISEKDIPDNIKKILGNKNGEIINTLILDVIEHSKDKDYIGFSDEKYEQVSHLKKFNYKYIYNHETLLNYNKFCHKIIFDIFEYLESVYSKNKDNYDAYENSKIGLVKNFGDYLFSMRDFYKNEPNKPEVFITDYISGMTDFFALEAIKQITIPQSISFIK